jgi:O-antigen/teichoic acid export membrane protein
VLIGAGRVRTVAIALICGSVLNLGISLLLIRQYGLAGVAIATVSASVVIDLIAMPILLQRFVGLSAWRFVTHACARPLAAGALQALALWGIWLTGRPDHWIQLLAQGVAAGLASVAIILTIGVTSAERQRFVMQPIRRFLRPARSTVEVPTI